jgi:hypothetical protein
MAVKDAGSLDEFIEKAALECLNHDPAHPALHAFEPGAETYLSSDASVDHELLLKVQFRQPIRLSGIRIIGSTEDETAPQTVKLFQGKDHMGFEEAGDEEPVQAITFEADQVNKGVVVPVRFVKFQCVTSLQLFFQENFGADVTKVQRIEFIGEPAQKMDMKEFKPIKG